MKYILHDHVNGNYIYISIIITICPKLFLDQGLNINIMLNFHVHCNLWVHCTNAYFVLLEINIISISDKNALKNINVWYIKIHKCTCASCRWSWRISCFWVFLHEIPTCHLLCCLHLVAEYLTKCAHAHSIQHGCAHDMSLCVCLHIYIALVH